MRITPICLVVSLGCGTAVAAGEPACQKPFQPLDDPSTAALREVAPFCSDPEVALLFYNRAYHREVLADLQLLQRLETYRTSEDRARYEQSRIYAGLIEAFAQRAWDAGHPGAIDALNGAYDVSITTVEYAIKGYTLLIGRIGEQP